MSNGGLRTQSRLHIMQRHGWRSMGKFGTCGRLHLLGPSSSSIRFEAPNICLISRSIGRITSASRNHFHTFTSHRQDIDTPSSSVVHEPPLSHALRGLMRGMPHSVVVATASTGEDSTPQSFKGMTVSSFTTLTLTPTPIITFNIKKPSKTLDAIRSSRHFLIHVLSATESGAKVADAFTKGNDLKIFQNPAFNVMRIKSNDSKHEPPLLSANGITQVLRCKVRSDPGGGLLDIGDHTLVLGDVVSIIKPPPADPGLVVEERGLCYLDREYRQVGSVIGLNK